MGKMLQGFGVGIFSSLLPKFIAETAPIEQRGVFGPLYSIGIVSGIMITSVQGYLIPAFPVAKPSATLLAYK
jgi:MFS family permease